MSEVMYDSPTEFLQDVMQKSDRCVAQSVIPLDDGSYACALTGVIRDGDSACAGAEGLFVALRRGQP